MTCPHDLDDPTWCNYCSDPWGSVFRDWRDSRVAALPHVSRCKECWEPIMWVRSEKGKSMPIEVESGGGEDARFRKDHTEVHDNKVVGVVHFVKDREIEANTAKLYACHWDRCTAREKKAASAAS